jgi:hypothetical protein
MNATQTLQGPSKGESWPWRCALDCEPGPLVPARSIDEACRTLAERRPLVVNPGLGMAGTTVWVTDPVSSLVTPYALGKATAAYLATIKPGEGAPCNMPQNVCLPLLLAGVLIEPLAARGDRESRNTELRVCKISFVRVGHAVIRHLLPPLLLGSLRRHYRRLVESGSMRLGDSQSRHRYVAHNEAMARFVHGQLLQTMCVIAGLKLKPSYAYAACYLRGAILPRHTDREQCEYSVSLCLDYAPEPYATTSWPLWLDTAAGPVPIDQSLGDALFYRGRCLPHFRTQLAAGEFSTSLFLHYVDERFAGSLT